MERQIIRIDESKCDGCGICCQGCPEGALQMIEGKARLVSEITCDGQKVNGYFISHAELAKGKTLTITTR